MFRAKFWFLVVIFGASCVVPDVEVADPTESEGGDSGSGAGPSSGGKSNSSPPIGGEGGGPGPSTSGSSSLAGSDTGASPTGGSGPTPPATAATGKFCNDITFADQSITLTLEIGTGAKRVVMSAASGTCTPVSGLACKAIPTGTGIPITLLDGSDPIVTYPVEIADGDNWIFLAYTDGESVDVAGDPVTKDVCELGYDAPSPGSGT